MCTPVICAALYLAATLSCFRCCTLSYTPLILSQYRLALFRSLPPPSPPILSWSLGRPAGSQRCTPALISVTRVGLTLHHLWVPQRFEGWGWTGGMWSQQFPGQPLRRVNYSTNQMPPPVMVSGLVSHASFAHLAFFLRLPEFCHVAPLRRSAGFLPGRSFRGV